MYEWMRDRGKRQEAEARSKDAKKRWSKYYKCPWMLMNEEVNSHENIPPANGWCVIFKNHHENNIHNHNHNHNHQITIALGLAYESSRFLFFTFVVVFASVDSLGKKRSRMGGGSSDTLFPKVSEPSHVAMLKCCLRERVKRMIGNWFSSAASVKPNDKYLLDGIVPSSSSMRSRTIEPANAAKAFSSAQTSFGFSISRRSSSRLLQRVAHSNPSTNETAL